MEDSELTEIHAVLLAIARLLVDQPKDIQVSLFQEEGGTVFQIRSNAADVGKLIGRQGRNALAMRTILRAASMRLKLNLRLDLDIDQA